MISLKDLRVSELPSPVARSFLQKCRITYFPDSPHILRNIASVASYQIENVIVLLSNHSERIEKVEFMEREKESKRGFKKYEMNIYESLGRMKSLRSLTIRVSAASIVSAFPKCFSEVVSLKQLHLNTEFFEEEQKNQTILSLIPKCFPCLEVLKLHIKNSTLVTIPTLKHLSSLGQLRCLGIYGKVKIDHFWTELYDSCPFLQQLILEDSDLAGFSMKNKISCFKGLKRLSFINLNNGEGELLDVIDSFVDLKELNISVGNSGVFTERQVEVGGKNENQSHRVLPFESLVGLKFRGLEKLSLTWKMIKDQSKFLEMIKALGKLEELHIIKCGRKQAITLNNLRDPEGPRRLHHNQDPIEINLEVARFGRPRAPRQNPRQHNHQRNQQRLQDLRLAPQHAWHAQHARLARQNARLARQNARLARQNARRAQQNARRARQEARQMLWGNIINPQRRGRVQNGQEDIKNQVISIITEHLPNIRSLTLDGILPQKKISDICTALKHLHSLKIPASIITDCALMTLLSNNKLSNLEIHIEKLSYFMITRALRSVRNVKLHQDIPVIKKGRREEFAKRNAYVISRPL